MTQRARPIDLNCCHCHPHSPTTAPNAMTKSAQGDPANRRVSRNNSGPAFESTRSSFMSLPRGSKRLPSGCLAHLAPTTLSYSSGTFVGRKLSQVVSPRSASPAHSAVVVKLGYDHHRHCELKESHLPESGNTYAGLNLRHDVAPSRMNAEVSTVGKKHFGKQAAPYLPSACKRILQPMMQNRRTRHPRLCCQTRCEPQHCRPLRPPPGAQMQPR